MQVKNLLLFVSLLSLLMFGLDTHSLARSTDSIPSIFERLTAVEAAKMTLEADFTSIVANKKTNQYFPATLTTEDGKTYSLELKPRGKFRRKISQIPPLKMKFKKKALLAEGLDSLNEIKLVLPTIDSDDGDELIIREYLIYRMFEKMTGASLRARLIRLTIRDTHVEKSKRNMFAILVEDEEEICARLNGEPVEQYGLPVDSLITNQAALSIMFEYMIGNTDWEIAMMRNVRLIRSRESGKVLVVPYDFDFSGLVNAPYASPSSESGLKTVRDRFLMSNGMKTEHLRKAIQQIRASKKDLYDICRSKHLSRASVSDMIDFLDTFFVLVESKDEVPITARQPVGD